MIYLGADYAGYTLKEAMKKYFDRRKITYHDFGTYTDEKKNDFPDFAYPVAKKVATSRNNIGILFCATGFGMDIAANRFRRVRATLVINEKQARWAKTHDGSNVLVFSAWSTTFGRAIKIFNIWRKTTFQPFPRRVRRFKKIDSWRT